MVLCCLFWCQSFGNDSLMFVHIILVRFWLLSGHSSRAYPENTNFDTFVPRNLKFHTFVDLNITKNC